MKQINSILRTLCLMALLCMTSVNASAYKVYDDSFAFYSPTTSMGNERILVIDRDIETKSFATPRGEYAYIIKPGVTVTVTQFFDIGNDSKLYVFGTLLLKDGMENQSNGGTIYIATGGTLTFNGRFSGLGTKTNVSPETILTKAKLSGQKPEPGKPGWKDCWAKGISESNDFGPMYCYEDEELKNEIPDFEAWKKGDGKLCVLQLGDDEYIHDGKSLDANVCFKDKVVYDLNVNLDVTGKITYSRTFAATGVWQAWFVPFDVTVDKMNQAGMEVAQIADVHISANEQVNIAVAEMTNTDAIVKANTPYLVKAKKSEVNMTLTGPVILRKSTDAELEGNRLTMQSAYNTSKIGGIYSEQQNSDWYALSSGGTFSKTNGTSLQPQRLWLTIKPRTDSLYTDPSASSELLIDGNVLDSFTTPLTDCPAVKVTKGDKTVILYAPDAVEMIKIPANK